MTQYSPLVPLEEGSSDQPPAAPVRIALFGATGSIGESTLQLVKSFPEELQLEAAVAGSSVERMVDIAKSFTPPVIGFSSEDAAAAFKEQCPSFQGELLAGENEITAYSGQGSYDLHLAAIVGMAGLPSFWAALQGGKRIALANKESLVAAGELVRSEVNKTGGSKILPVDSEHSSLFQLLRTVRRSAVHSIVLTASGGPFREKKLSELKEVTPEEAVNHPTWKMGAKISVDSATLMNKGLELIEAHYLFGYPENQIEVLTHPQSIIHAMVRLRDGGMTAHLSNPRMELPIAHAVFYPAPPPSKVVSPLNFSSVAPLTLEEMEPTKAKTIGLARQAVRSGGSSAAVLNTANEAAVEAFRAGRISFPGIASFIERTLEQYSGSSWRSIDELISGCSELRVRLLQGDHLGAV